MNQTIEPIHRIPPDLVRGPEFDMLAQAGEANWGVEVFGVEQLRKMAPPPIMVGIVDTGVDRTHPLLEANHVASKSFVGDNNPMDRNGHGSHCTGTVCGINPQIGMAAGFPYVHGKGLADNGSGGNGLIAAMWWCVEQGAKILSCSWGGGGQSAAWEREFQRMNDAGVWMFFAAGNSGGGTSNTDWPGRSEQLLNVAALNRDLTPASFTSRGDKIDTAFAGVNIISARPGGGFATMSGTSMATPGVAGVMAIFRAVLEHRGMPIPKGPELRPLLFERSTDTHTPGDDLRTGPGWVSAALLALAAEPPPPPVRPK